MMYYEEEYKDRDCKLCSQPVRGFRDTLSLREFTLSGWCQACQDETFGRAYSDVPPFYGDALNDEDYYGGPF